MMNASYLSDNNSVNNTFIKTNIKDKYNGTKKMQELLNKGSQDNKTVLLFVDNKNTGITILKKFILKIILYYSATKVNINCFIASLLNC